MGIAFAHDGFGMTWEEVSKMLEQWKNEPISDKSLLQSIKELDGNHSR